MVDTTTVQKPEFATELKPLAEAVYGATVPQFQKRLAEGYITPTTPLVTPFSAEELQSMAGISALARGPGATPSYQFGQQMAGMAAAPIGEVDISRLMSPYMSGVTEAAKRRAVEDFQRTTMQPLMTRATSEGGLRGARAAIERSQAYEGLGRNLADIEATGLQKAYEQAIAAAQAERNRMLQAAPQYAQLGQSGFEADVQRLGLLSGVGETQRTMADALRQAQLGQEVAALNYPEAVFSQYTGFLGQPGAGRTDTVVEPEKPSGISQAIGTGLGVVTALPSIVQGIKSIFGGATGGRVGGLSSLVKFQTGGSISEALKAASLAADEARKLELDAMRSQELPGPDSWITRNLGITYKPGDMTPAEQAAMAQKFLTDVAEAPTQRKTALGQLGEAIIRSAGVYGGAKAESVAKNKQQAAALAGAKSKAAKEKFEQTMQMVESAQKQQKFSLDQQTALYKALGDVAQFTAALEDIYDPEQQTAIRKQLFASLSPLLKQLGIPSIGDVDTEAPPSTGGSTPAKQQKRDPAAAADEVLRRRGRGNSNTG